LNYGQAPHHPLSLAARPISSEFEEEKKGDGARQAPIETEEVSEWIGQMTEELRQAKLNLEAAQESQRRQHNQNRREPDRYKVGDQVLLTTNKLKAYKKKLHAKYIGPFEIVKVFNELNVEVKLPPALEIHPRLHVERLKPFKEDKKRFPTRRQVYRPIAVIGKRKKAEFEIERIVDEREIEDGWKEYLVTWKGYSIDDASWQKEWQMGNAKAVIDRWNRLQQMQAQEEKEQDGTREEMQWDVEYWTDESESDEEDFAADDEEKTANELQTVAEDDDDDEKMREVEEEDEKKEELIEIQPRQPKGGNESQSTSTATSSATQAGPVRKAQHIVRTYAEAVAGNLRRSERLRK
jgi:hypothetical protein